MQRDYKFRLNREAVIAENNNNQLNKMAAQKVSSQGGSYAWKPLIYPSPQSGLFPLSYGPALLESQTQRRSQPEILLVWATLGVPKFLWVPGYKTGVWVSSPGTVSAVSLLRFRGPVLSDMSDTNSHLESTMLNV